MLTVLLFLLVSPIFSKPLQEDKDAKIITLDAVNFTDGTGYKFAYESSNGITRSEVGEILLKGTKDEYLSVQGFYSYLGPNNVRYTVRYTADKNGFHPITSTDDTGSAAKVDDIISEFPDNIGSALLSTLSGGGVG